MCIHLLGPDLPCGAYLLHLRLSARQCIHMGARGPVAFPAGDYLYIGSAMGRRGASSLGHRLVRHATRSKGPPHGMRGALAEALGVRLPARKTLRWNVDHLLECLEVELVEVVVLRSEERQEHALAERLQADARSSVVVAGLGASDHRGATHLLRVDTTDGRWWLGL